MSSYRTIASLKGVDDFRAYLQELAPELDCSSDPRGPAGPLAQSAEVSGLHIGNRFTVHPMEGWDATREGLPSEHTLRRWRNFGRSGCKLIWGGEAFAVQERGRANPGQLFLNPDSDVLAGLKALRAELLAGHAEVGESEEGLVIGLQLTHSGRWSRPTVDGAAPLTAARHAVLDAKQAIADDSRLLPDEDLPAIIDGYVRAAQFAQQAGFDFVDVKACHGYLLHEFLSARSRPGPYGGSFENRTRLFREIIAAIRAACPRLVIGVRVSIVDIFPHAPGPDGGIGIPAGIEQNLPYEQGFGVQPDEPCKHEWEEPFAFLKLLEELDISLVNLSMGSPYYCPHLQRPAAFPPSDGYRPPEDPLASVADHLRTARRCKAAFPGLFFVGSGYSYLQEYAAHVADHEVGAGHVDSVGFGRLMLSYPELPLHLLRGEELQTKRICRTFSDCTTGPRNGMLSGCFPLDPYYRVMPEAARVRPLRGKRMDKS